MGQSKTLTKTMRWTVDGKGALGGGMDGWGVALRGVWGDAEVKRVAPCGAWGGAREEAGDDVEAASGLR